MSGKNANLRQTSGYSTNNGTHNIKAFLIVPARLVSRKRERTKNGKSMRIEKPSSPCSNPGSRQSGIERLLPVLTILTMSSAKTDLANGNCY